MSAAVEIAEIRARLDRLEKRETVLILWEQRTLRDWTTEWVVTEVADSGGLRVTASTFPRTHAAHPEDSYGDRSDPDVFIGLAALEPAEYHMTARTRAPDGTEMEVDGSDRDDILLVLSRLKK